MAKRINKNMVAALTVAGMLVTTIVVVAMVMMLPKKDPAFYVEQAKQVLEAKDYVKASSLYRKAYRVSKDPKYLLDAGRVFYDIGDFGTALGVYRETVVADARFLPGHLEMLRVTLEYARLLTESRSPSAGKPWHELLEICDKIQALDEQHPEMRHARGLALVNLRSEEPDYLEQGIADLKRAVELSPQDPQVAMDLATQYEEVLKDEQKAEDVLRALVKRDESNAEAHRHYGEFLSRRAARAGEAADAEKRKKQALVELEKAVELNPKDVENHIALGRYYYLPTQGNDRKKAEECFAKATEVEKDGYRSYLNLGMVHMQQGELEKALDVFRERLKTPPVRRGFMGTMRRNNHFMMLRQALSVALGLAQREEDKEKKEAYFVEAMGYLKSARAELGENAMTHQMEGEIHMARGLDKDAIVQFEKAEDLSRSVSIDLKRKLAALYARTGSPGLAKKAMLDILRVETASLGAGTIHTLYNLARIENQLHNPREALVYSNEIQRQDPKSKLAFTAQMESYRQLEDYKRVAALSKLVGGDSITDQVRGAQIAVLQDDLETAEKTFRAILEKTPESMTAVRPFVAMLVDQERQKEASGVLDKAIAADPDNKQFKQMKNLLQGGTDPEKREELILKQIEENEHIVSREYQLGNFFARKGKDFYEEAIKHYILAEKALSDPEVVNKLSESARRGTLTRVLERRFGLLILLRDWKRAEALVEQCAKDNADGVNGLFYRGRLAMTQGDLEQAIEYLKAGLNQYPSSSEGLQWLGAAHLKGNNFEEARSLLEQALDINPNNGYAHLGLTQLYDALGNEEKKAEHLKSCERLLPNDPWVRNELQLQQEKDDPAKGIARREEIRKKEPENLSNLMRLAGLYLMNKQPEKAEECALAALKSEPDNTRLVAGVAEFYRAMNGDKDGKGEALLKKHIQSLEEKDKKANAQLLLAHHYSTLRQFDKAEMAFKVAAEINANVNVCLSTGRWKQFAGRWEEAAEWYRKCLVQMEKPSVYVNRLLLEAVLNSTERKGLGEELQRYRTNFPDDPMLLIYEGRAAISLGQLDDATRKFDLYLEKEKSNALGYYLRGRLRFLRNQYDLAIEDLGRAKNLAPRSFDYLHRMVLSTILAKLGRVDEAINELDSILKEDPKAYLVARALSDLYAHSKRYVEQETFVLRYENMDAKNPFWPIARSRLLEALKRPQPAMDALAKACRITEFDPNVVNEVAPRLIAYGKGNPKLYDNIIEMIGEKIPEEKRSPTLLRWLAQAYYLKGEKEKALATYDKALNAASTDHSMYTVVAGGMANTLGLDQLMEMTRARIQKDKSDQTAVRLLAELLIAKDASSSEALSILESLLAAEKDDAKRVTLLNRLGVVKYSQEKYAEAVKFYEKALELNGRDAFALNNLAYILAEEMGQPKQALPYALLGAEVKPTGHVFDTVGWCYVLLKQYDNAIAWLIRAKEIDMELVASGFHLGEAYRLNGDTEAAKRELEAAYKLAKEQNSKAFLGPIAESMKKLGMQPG